MPHIIVYCPRLARDNKIACVAALTEAFERTTGHSAELLTIHIEEHSYDNVGVAESCSRMLIRNLRSGSACFVKVQPDLL